MVAENGRRAVADIENEVGFHGFFQGGFERLDEMMGQAADKSHRVHQHDVSAGGQGERPRCRVECGEQHIFRQHARVGQRIEQRGFSRVGIAHNGDRHNAVPSAAFPITAALSGDFGKFFFQIVDFSADMTAIGFEFGFTRTARADTAAQTAHGNALAGQTGQHIAKLRQFDLQLALARTCSPGENIENEHGAVNRADVGGVFDVAHLNGGEFAVKDDEADVVGAAEFSDFLQKSRTHAGCRIGRGTLLHHHARDLRARRASQLPQFRHRFFGVAFAEVNAHQQRGCFLLFGFV